MPGVSEFMERYFRHFNARETLNAARAFQRHIENGGAMLVAMGGAMSTAELGACLSRMIREKKVHAICCTGANLEEDFFRLIGARSYRMLSAWRTQSATDDVALRDGGYNRVTDVAIPEETIEAATELLRPLWHEAASMNRRRYPYEWFYDLVRSSYHLLEANLVSESWLCAAAEHDLPLFVPGFEDSSVGSMLVADRLCGRLNAEVFRTGTEELARLARWYSDISRNRRIGFFQIGGGIAGDFAISVVPLLLQDADAADCPMWGYFAQVSDSTTSYGSYSGAPPNEKITWWKIDANTPAFMVESDATIVAPLIFGYVLGD